MFHQNNKIVKYILIFFISLFAVAVGVFVYYLTALNLNTRNIFNREYLAYVLKNEIVSQEGFVVEAKKVEMLNDNESYSPVFYIKLAQKNDGMDTKVFLFDRSEMENLEIFDKVNKPISIESITRNMRIKIGKTKRGYRIDILK